MKFLSPDSGLMRGWNNLTDGVWINILMLVTSIPLVTVGAGSAVLRVGRSADCTVANSKIRFHHRMDHGLRMGLGVTGSFRK